MSNPKNIKLVTTFFLLKAHEPSDPPSITDAGSQAGQAFNQVLRYIAGCSGFHSQLFGWPTQPDPDDVNMNDYMASIVPGIVAIFVNWADERSATNFLLPTSLKQAFQGFATFFDTPSGRTVRVPGAGFSVAPLAINIGWDQTHAVQILERTKDPLRLRIVHDQIIEEEPEVGCQSAKTKAIGAVMGSEGAHIASIKIENVLDQALLGSLLSNPNDKELCLSLMRTRYCSRLKEGLNEMIRSRRVD